MANWQPCVCGGVILVAPGQTVEEAVTEHQDEPRHLKWHIAQLEAELAVYIKERPNLHREGRLYE